MLRLLLEEAAAAAAEAAAAEAAAAEAAAAEAAANAVQPPGEGGDDLGLETSEEPQLP